MQIFPTWKFLLTLEIKLTTFYICYIACHVTKMFIYILQVVSMIAVDCTNL